METVFSVVSAPRLHNEDPEPAEIELMDSLETALEGDWEEMAANKLKVSV
jgi:hypothetical protein